MEFYFFVQCSLNSSLAVQDLPETYDGQSSSHGIDQYRIHGLKLTAAAFTNFSQDNLDFHKDINEYFGAKKRLFYEVLPEGKTAILNADVNE
jgi:UDP-N-acetylmuramoyl-L-alanyl-D-glutamate--2,6-diaminopimelate ligase